MLLDDNLVFFDGKEIKAEATSEPVALNSLFKPGKNHDVIPMIVTFTEAAEGGTSLKLTLQQGDTPDGAFEDVPGGVLDAKTADMAPGRSVGWRYLPAGVTKPWMKLKLSPTGTFTKGKLFVAVTREDVMPYDEGLYIDKGETIA